MLAGLAEEISVLPTTFPLEIVDVPRFYPSSKTCSECGSIKKDLKLSDREYICEECGCVIDRDLNASINLAKYQQLVV